MKDKFTKKFATHLFICIIMSALSFSCEKELKEVTAVIKVVDSSQQPVAGASVKVHQENVTNPKTGASSSIKSEKTTDANGITEHVFSPALEMILIIDVTKDTLFATDYIHFDLEEEKEEKTIVLK